MKQAVKNFFVRVGHVFTKLEAAAKTAMVTVAGGGVTAVADAVKTAHLAHTFTVDAAHLVQLKASFISGACVAFVGYLMQFPAFKPKQ